MKVINSKPVSAFGGLNFVIQEAINLKLNTLLNASLPALPKQSQYNWFDIIMSYWSVFFCGGDCAENLSINLKEGLKNNPFIHISSPDRILNRLKSLSDSPQIFAAKRGKQSTISHWPGN
nr:hypothetical protein [uncultured Draconibacterium sp.]